ncbi:hypothetical protein HPB48_022827 [Haemaphysalis longicornis]|uniref:Uncharacterized protein n=1 Tax=Haemaphysalis longicornis TaxID=44386 RepID=A0A9J6GZ29_HAELO|nr:hypothetical protein HPB48_022827 [Haemaphysalis longicornis]
MVDQTIPLSTPCLRLKTRRLKWISLSRQEMTLPRHLRKTYCTTFGAARKPASTARSRTELITVGNHLPPGTLTPKLPLYDLHTAIASAAQLSSKTSEEITLQAKPTQSLVFLKTYFPLTAHLLLSVTSGFMLRPSTSNLMLAALPSPALASSIMSAAISFRLCRN